MKNINQKIYKIIIDNKVVEVTITKKQKKTFSIIIKSHNQINLNIPHRVPYEDALKLMKTKDKWISQKLKKHSDVKKTDNYYFLGEEYSLNKIKDLAKNSGFLNNQKEFILEEWYLHQLQPIIKGFIEKHAPTMSGYPKKINLKFLKSAWGICYSTGTITFNIDLIKTPKNIIEYVVVHELGHMKHPNHSKNYWEYIENFIENPKSSRKWLRDNGHKFITKK